jgi:hypothetical protein
MADPVLQESKQNLAQKQENMVGNGRIYSPQSVAVGVDMMTRTIRWSIARQLGESRSF